MEGLHHNSHHTKEWYLVPLCSGLLASLDYTEPSVIFKRLRRGPGGPRAEGLNGKINMVNIIKINYFHNFA